jgi:RimJ/RimL family protein N-acetyltransferase
MIALTLVPFGPEHVDWLGGIAGEAEVARFTRFPVPVPEGWAQSWFERYRAGRADGSREAFVALGPDGRYLGLALAPEISAESRELELGYLVDPAARGQGVATELLRQLTEWAFREKQVERIQLMIDVANVGSAKAAQRCGYVLEGTLRSSYFKNGERTDVQIWSKLPTD